MTSISYYDIDEILADEELMPVTNNFDFTCLAHLDPDYVHSNSNSTPQDEPQKVSKPQNYCLNEGTKFKMPLWSIQKWAQLGFVRLQFPKHFGRRARERLDADPVSVDLRKRNERFYISGMAIINLIQKCTIDSKPHNLHHESLLLKQALLESYTGARIRRIFDWTLSNIEDDVSSYTKKLTEMEMRLFQRGAQASHAYTMWKLYGSRRIHVSETALRTSVMGNRVTPATKRSANTVSPEGAPLRNSRKRTRAY